MGKNTKRQTGKGKAAQAHVLGEAFDLNLRDAMNKLKIEEHDEHRAEPARDKPVVAPSSPVVATSSSVTANEEACDTSEGNSEMEPDSIIAQRPVVFNIPKHPILIFQIVTREHGQTLRAQYMQKPTGFRIKPDSGFIEVDVPVLTHKHQRPDKSKDYGMMIGLKKKHPDALSNGLSGGFASASDEKGKGTFGGVDYEELLEDIEEAHTYKYDTQVYAGRIVPRTLEEPIEMVMFYDGSKWNVSPVMARVQLRPQLQHQDNFREFEDVKSYDEAAMRKAATLYGSESGDEIYPGDYTGGEDSSGGEGTSYEAEDSEAPELPGHDADYPATDYADTEDDEKEPILPQKQSASSEAKPVGMSVKSSDEKKDERTVIEKRLDEIKAEKWISCKWKDEDEPESREYKKNFSLDGEEASIELTTELTRDAYLDLLSCLRYDATKGVHKGYYNHETEDSIVSGDSSHDEETSASEDEEESQ